jgi:hypothetical protein
MTNIKLDMFATTIFGWLEGVPEADALGKGRNIQNGP